MAKKETIEENKILCCTCGCPDPLNFYLSNTKHNNFSKVIPYCKDCICEKYNYYNNLYKDEKKAIYYTCRFINVPFVYNIYTGAIKKAEKTNKELIFYYISIYNSFKTNNKYPEDFDNGEELFVNDLSEIKKEVVFTDSDEKNRMNVLDLLGYDPFEYEEDGKKYLYNTLAEFLDESTLEDSFKLPIVIRIVKGFGMADKLDRSSAELSKTTQSVIENIDTIKRLEDSKEKIVRSALAMAKDNGISANHSLNGSKGAGTLSGMIKKLKELKFDEIEINSFDIETSAGMKQVADISNQSILKQLNLNENDYTNMISNQLNIIEEKTTNLEKMEEENRLLKIKMQKINKEIGVKPKGVKL